LRSSSSPRWLVRAARGGKDRRKKSPYIDVRGHATIHGHFLRAEIVAVPDPGHNPHMEARAAFVAAVLGK
jgi:pimeloyl-ACP methyl ester carboxylesterase